MAHPEHLQILKQGIEAWTQWQDQHLGIRGDLSHADLSGADLRAANLIRAKLWWVNLLRGRPYRG